MHATINYHGRIISEADKKLKIPKTRKTHTTRYGNRDKNKERQPTEA